MRVGPNSVCFCMALRCESLSRGRARLTVKCFWVFSELFTRVFVSLMYRQFVCLYIRVESVTREDYILRSLLTM